MPLRVDRTGVGPDPGDPRTGPENHRSAGGTPGRSSRSGVRGRRTQGGRSPVKFLTSEVLEALGSLCEPCAGTIVAMLSVAHLPNSLELVASAVGASGPVTLGRRLRKHGFPALSELQDRLWLCQLLWTHHSSGASLEQQAFAAGRDPSVARRMVKRVANVPWTEVSRRGLHEHLRTCPLRASPCPGQPTTRAG